MVFGGSKSAYMMAVITSMMLTVACNESGFQGGNSRKNLTSEKDKNKDANKLGKQSSNGPDGGDGGSSGNGGGNGSDPNNPNGSGDGLNDNGNGLDGLASGQDCKDVHQNYNILLVMDNSGSLRDNDPNSIRNAGTSRFVDRMAKYVTEAKKSEVSMAVVTFSSQARAMNGNDRGWSHLHLGGNAVSQVKSDLTIATTNPDGGTIYSSAFREANTLFSNLKSMNLMEKRKNILVFFSDGCPNTPELNNDPSCMPKGMGFPNVGLPPVGGAGGSVEQFADIDRERNDLINNYKAEIISIALGESIKEDVARNLSYPKDAAHYRRVYNASELETVWENLVGSITKCN